MRKKIPMILRQRPNQAAPFFTREKSLYLAHLIHPSRLDTITPQWRSCAPESRSALAMHLPFASNIYRDHDIHLRTLRTAWRASEPGQFTRNLPFITPALRSGKQWRPMRATRIRESCSVDIWNVPVARSTCQRCQFFFIETKLFLWVSQHLLHAGPIDSGCRVVSTPPVDDDGLRLASDAFLAKDVPELTEWPCPYLLPGSTRC
jgi:hypothetical protein